MTRKLLILVALLSIVAFAAAGVASAGTKKPGPSPITIKKVTDKASPDFFMH